MPSMKVKLKLSRTIFIPTINSKTPSDKYAPLKTTKNRSWNWLIIVKTPVGDDKFKREDNEFAQTHIIDRICTIKVASE